MCETGKDRTPPEQCLCLREGQLRQWNQAPMQHGLCDLDTCMSYTAQDCSTGQPTLVRKVDFK